MSGPEQSGAADAAPATPVTPASESAFRAEQPGTMVVAVAVGDWIVEGEDGSIAVLTEAAYRRYAGGRPEGGV